MHIIVCARAGHRSPSWARWNQSIPPHSISIKSILLLTYHLCIDLPSGTHPSGFPTMNCMQIIYSPVCCMPYASHSLWRDYSDYSSVRNTCYTASRRDVLFRSLSFHLYSVRMFCLEPLSQIPKVSVLPSLPENKFHKQTKLQANLYLNIYLFRAQQP